MDILEELLAEELPDDRQATREARILLADLHVRAAEEIIRLRTTLERIAQYDIQAWAMDALAPHERIRKAEDK